MLFLAYLPQQLGKTIQIAFISVFIDFGDNE